MTDTVPYYEDFTEIKKKIWSMLNNAVKDRSSPFRIPVFICGDQSDFDGRIVVLRKADEPNNLVQYHSDIRSDKIAKLKANKNAAMLFYDKEEKIQVRLKVEAPRASDDRDLGVMIMLFIVLSRNKLRIPLEVTYSYRPTGRPRRTSPPSDCQHNNTAILFATAARRSTMA